MRCPPTHAIHVCECTACQAGSNPLLHALHHQMNLFFSRLDEQQRRWYAALEAARIGHGGARQVARITGLSEKTIRRGRRELETALANRPMNRIRHPGGGRPAAETRDPALEERLEALLAPETAGNPQRAVKYKRSSLRTLSARLQEAGHPASRTTVGRLVKQLGYSLRGNARRKEAKSSPPERDAQFRYIAQQKQDFLKAGEPVISVDTKKRN